MKRLTSFALMSFAALLMATRDAHAYLDPGTGSLLLQGLIAGIAAASVVLGGYYMSDLEPVLIEPKDRKAQGRPAAPPEQ